MLLVGTIDCIPDMPINIFNLSSFTQKYPMLNILPPTDGSIPYGDEKQFDIAYANYIMSNDIIFMELMKIIIPLYEGQNVYILVSRNPFYDMVTESLIKFIQSRYSYNAQIIQDIEDLEYLDNGSTFNTIQGLYNLDQDKERFSNLFSPSRIENKYGAKNE